MNIVVIGSINTDLVINTNRMPQMGETISGSGFSVNCGGKGVNQAVAAAKLGGKVTFIGAVGNDENGFITSLSESDILKYTDRFRNIEIYTNRETLKSYWDKFEESLNLIEEEVV